MAINDLEISVMLSLDDVQSLCSGGKYFSKREDLYDRIASAYKHKTITDMPWWTCGFLCGSQQRPKLLPPYGDVEARLRPEQILHDIYVACDQDIKDVCFTAFRHRKDKTYSKRLACLFKVGQLDAFEFLINLRPERLGGYCELRIGRAISIEDVAGFFSRSGTRIECSEL